MKVKNAGNADLIIAGQARIPAGGEAEVDSALLKHERENNPAVAAWFDAGVLSAHPVRRKAPRKGA